MVNAPRKREGQQLLLRFPEGSDLRDRLKGIADANNRTLTAEIIHRLEATLEADAPDFTRLSADERLSLIAGQSGLENRVSELEVMVSTVTELLGVTVPEGDITENLDRLKKHLGIIR